MGDRSILGVLVDSWLEPLPLPRAPSALVVPETIEHRDAVFVELPLGTFEDATAMYRAIAHGHRLVNGMSGNLPPHYVVLRSALDEGDFDVLRRVAPGQEVIAFVSRHEAGRRLARALRERTWTASLGSSGPRDLFRLHQLDTAGGAPPLTHDAPIVAVRASVGFSDVGMTIDGDTTTAGVGSSPQYGGEVVEVELGRRMRVASVTMVLGRHAFAYPRELRILLSDDGRTWRQAWHGRRRSP